MKNFKEKYIGDRSFYKMILMIAVPIMIQNGISNFVSMLDNIMVGQIGTEQMSGVSIVNQILNVYYICIFGAVSGAGIFGAQYYGKGDKQKFQETFLFKIISTCLIAVGWIVFLRFFSGNLIQTFLHDGSATGNIEETFSYGKIYFKYIVVGMLPYAVSMSYAQTLREMGDTILPMKAGITAVLVNLVLDYCLIFGKFGMPELGVAGAAIATNAARVIECLIIVIYTHTHTKKIPFMEGVYKIRKITGKLALNIVLKGTPLLINETLWSAGMAKLVQIYSTRGLAVVAGINISSTISNLFNVCFIALGSSIAIVVGQLLGADKMKEAKDTDRKMIFFTVASCAVFGTIMFLVAPLFPKIYNTTDEVRGFATSFIMIASACMPLYAFMHGCYFTLRSGGKTIITFLFDSVYVWAVDIPLAFVLTYHTNMPIVIIYLCCQLIETIKCVIGYILVKKGVWINNIAKDM